MNFGSSRESNASFLKRSDTKSFDNRETYFFDLFILSLNLSVTALVDKVRQGILLEEQRMLRILVPTNRDNFLSNCRAIYAAGRVAHIRFASFDVGDK